jgi:hypothetical protein
MTALTRRETFGELGPAMRALPSDRWRDFAQYYVANPKTNGAEAARKAGFGKPNSTPPVMTQIAYRILCDDRMIAAVAELTKKIVRAAAPEASQALLEIIRDPDHKDRMRAIGLIMDRTDPVVTHQSIDVTHRHIDPVAEEIEELRALRQLGTTRDKLIELFGSNGLLRLERLEADDAAKNAKVIQAEVIDVQERGDGKTSEG